MLPLTLAIHRKFVRSLGRHLFPSRGDSTKKKGAGPDVPVNRTWDQRLVLQKIGCGGSTRTSITRFRAALLARLKDIATENGGVGRSRTYRYPKGRLGLQPSGRTNSTIRSNLESSRLHKHYTTGGWECQALFFKGLTFPVPGRY